MPSGERTDSEILEGIAQRWEPEFWRQHEQGMREQWQRQAMEDVGVLLNALKKVTSKRFSYQNDEGNPSYQVHFTHPDAGRTEWVMTMDIERVLLWAAAQSLGVGYFSLTPVMVVSVDSEMMWTPGWESPSIHL